MPVKAIMSRISKKYLMNNQLHLVKKYPANTAGRDFVVGDIHGAFTLVLMAMKRVGFNPSVDRLFCVGDLIDRGEESSRVSKFLAQPYVHAVRGNHEEMLIQLHSDGTFPEFSSDHWMVRRNGLGWWMNVSLEQKQTILSAIRKLPIAIEVETSRGTVGIVHAEVAAGLSWQEFLARLESGNEKVTETALWGRDRIKSADAMGVKGVDRVFVGHTPQWGGAKRFGNVYAVDTGAIFADIGKKEGARLTIMNLMHTSAVLVANEPDTVLNVLDQPVMQPFGSYATRS